MNVIDEIEKLRRHHTYCEDPWYSCPKAEGGCSNDGAGDECNCGADEHNAILDDIIAHLRPNNGVQPTAEAAGSQPIAAESEDVRQPAAADA